MVVNTPPMKVKFEGAKNMCKNIKDCHCNTNCKECKCGKDKSQEELAPTKSIGGEMVRKMIAAFEQSQR